MADIKYTVHDEFDKLIEEKGNIYIALKKLTWGDKQSEPKYDLRKWYIAKDGGSDTPGKGFSFLTEEGVHDLTHVVTESGFGNTKTIIDNIKDREDFNSSLIKSIGKEQASSIEGLEIVEDDDEDLYDPKAIFD